MKYFKDSDPIVECVPNFSEGRDRVVIEKIAEAIASVDDVKILHKDIGYDANRTVITFAGLPDAVLQAAYKGIAVAADKIDMQKHQGEHPRMGATDVCPLIPLRNISMNEVIALSRKLGKLVGEDLGIPVYLYEQSAEQPKRKKLEQIRKGQYESIQKKISMPEWVPDFGPAVFNERSGMTAIGARPILIAFNVNLNTKDVALAKQIAGRIRESGYLENGIRKPGKLKGVKAIGWYMQDYGCAQVSTNITDINASPIELVFESIKEEALSIGCDVNGSELIGLIPLDIITKAGRFYGSTMFHDNNNNYYINLAISNLGLNSLSNFTSDEKIIEFRL